MRKILASIYLEYIKLLAKIALCFFRGKIIGIAGSVGKTSTKNAVKCVLMPFGNVIVTEGNSETGVPLGILGIKQGDYGLSDWLLTAIKCPFKIFSLVKCDYLVVEMGTDDFVWPKNMEFLLSVVKPEYVVWLNTSPAHLEQFGADSKTKDYDDNLHQGRLSLANEDGKILTKNNFKVAIVNKDDSYVVDIINKNKLNEKVISFGSDIKNNSYLIDYKINFPNTYFKIKLNNKELDLNFSNQLLAKEYWQVFSSTLLLVDKMELDIDEAIGVLTRQWQMPNGRGRLLKAVNDSWMLDGSYNASPDAFLSQLNLLREASELTGLRPVVVVGDMRELGKVTAEAHKLLAEQIIGVAKEVYAVGQNCFDYLLPSLRQEGIDAGWYKNSHELAIFLKNNLKSKALILVKGSQNTIFLEEVVEKLLADKSDVKMLCRQSAYWQGIRDGYFNSNL